MWANELDPAERDAIVSDIQELIDDCAQPEKVEGVYVRFDDFDRIASDVRKFKDTAAMPRRTTLYKIARALNLSQVQTATEWSV